MSRRLPRVGGRGSLTLEMIFRYFIEPYLRLSQTDVSMQGGGMPLLIRKYKLASGLKQVERIDDPDRIDRYKRLFEKDDLKKLESGQKVFIEKDEWELLP